MKLLVLTEKFPPDISVNSLRISELVNTFDRAGGCEIEVLVYNPEVKTGRLRTVNHVSRNLRVVRYGRRFLPGFAYRFAAFNPLTLFFWILVCLIESFRYKPEKIFASVPTFNPMIASYICHLLFKTRAIIDIRDDWLSRDMGRYMTAGLPWYVSYPCDAMYRAYRRIFIRSCESAEVVSVVYDVLIADLRAALKKRVPILHMPNGINRSELLSVAGSHDRNAVLEKNGLPVSRDARYVIFAGTLNAYYDPSIILPALAELARKGLNLHFIIIGDGHVKYRVAGLARQLDIADRVHLLGKKPHREVIELLLASDVALYMLDRAYPSQDSALGMKVIEYIACKLPVLSIASGECIVSRIVGHNHIGVSLNWEQLDEIDQALETLLSDARIRQNLEQFQAEFVQAYDREANNLVLYNHVQKVSMPGRI